MWHVASHLSFDMETSLVNISCVTQEILLGEITGVETVRSIEEEVEGARNPHVFEMRTAIGTVYYVGEDPTWGGRKEEVVTSAESGIGREQALCWENAIRQALMPVTPQPSAEAPAESMSSLDPLVI